MHIAVIIPAAGSGARYLQTGGMRSKIDEDLGGKPVLQRAVELFTKHDLVKTIVVAGPHDDEAFTEFKQRHGDRLGLLGAVICKGGKTHRWETVKAALALVPGEATHIAVHDAARPATPPELIDRVFELAERFAGVVPALEVTDTLKRVTTTSEPERRSDDAVAAILGMGDDEDRGPRLRVIESTVDRAGLFGVQTPQVFRADLLRAAYAQKDLSSTDDAGLVESLLHARGGKATGTDRVIVTDGDARNLKITRSGDLGLVRAIMGVKPPEERAAHKRF